MPRVRTAYVSQFQRARVHNSRFYRRETFVLKADFNGALPDGELITGATWWVYDPYCVVLSSDSGVIDERETHITCTANYAPGSTVKVEVTTDGGTVMSQMFVINVLDAPTFVTETYLSAGPTQVTLTETYPVIVDGFVMDIVVMQGNGGFLLYQYDTIEETGGVIAVDTTPVYFDSRPFLLNDDIVMNPRLDGVDSPAIVAYRDNGLGGFDTIATITHTTRECRGVVKLSESRIVAWFKSTGPLAHDAELYSYDGSAFTLLDTLSLSTAYGKPDYLTCFAHNGLAIFPCTGAGDNKFMIISNTADTLSVAYSTTGPANGAVDGLSTGDTIVNGDGMMWTCTSTDVVLVQPVNDATYYVAYDGARVYITDGETDPTSYRLATYPYTLTAQSTAYGAAPCGSEGYVFLPSDTHLTAQPNAILKWNGLTYDTVSDFTFNQWEPLSDIYNMAATTVRTTAVSRAVVG